MQATERPRPIIGFLTDFGLDGAAATCRAVMLSICRDAQIVDIGHTLRKYAIRDGAFLLRFSLPYFPVGVHVGVVDPGVGTARRPIAIRAGRGDVLIGPDNGLLVPAAEALGGVGEARQLANRELWLPVTTTTFHGRDIFAPVAGHLANGAAAFEDVGPVVEPGTLVRLPEPAASVDGGAIRTTVTYVDSFGNVRLAGGADELRTAFGELSDGDPLLVELGGPDERREPTRYGTTFGAVPAGASLVYVDSLGNLALADNQGSIATRLGIAHDRPVRISRPST
jgi:S-adenosylmethionine hydrolase